MNRSSIHSWSKNTIEFQEQITGVKVGNAFEVNGVRFDGVIGDVLLEAKSGYKNFVGKDGKFKDFFLDSKTGAKSLLSQAKRQSEAAKRAKIEWHFENKEVMEATSKLFENKNFNIILKHTQKKGN